MGYKGKIIGVGLLLLVCFSIALIAANEPAKSAAGSAVASAKEAVAKVHSASDGSTYAAAPASPVKAAAKAPAPDSASTALAKTLDSNKPLEGTVVIKSSSDSADEDPYAGEEDASAEDKGPSFTLAKDPKTGLLTIDAPGEDIRSIVRKVADLYSLNIVIPAGLNGATTLKLRDVAWQQLFQVMLQPAGYSYVEDKNIILIKSREEISAEPTETRVFLINYAAASDLSSSITPLVDASNGGRIQVDKRSNALVITERPSRFNNIKDIIERLDHATPQVMIESKFIEITDANEKDLGANWSSLSAYKLSASNLQRSWTHTHKDPTNGTKTWWTDTAVFAAPEFDIVLSALNSLSGSNLVSNPTVVTLNNTEALINIGQEYPIPQYSYNQQTGVFEVSGFEYKPIGINLKVTPQVNSQGFITLAIAPEVSSQTGEVNFGSTSSGSNGASIPIISTRKTSSTITIKDGYTLAIGGLIEVTKNSTTAKIPFLGDVPIVGKAFNGSTDKVNKRNLVIFITARTVSPDGSGRSVISQKDLNDMGVTDSDLPGFVPSAEEEKLQKELAARREAAKREKSLRSLRHQPGASRASSGTPSTSPDDDESPSRAHNL